MLQLNVELPRSFNQYELAKYNNGITGFGHCSAIKITDEAIRAGIDDAWSNYQPNPPVQDTKKYSTVDEARANILYNDGDQSKVTDRAKQQNMLGLWSFSRNWRPFSTIIHTDFATACIHGNYEVVKRTLDSVKDNEIEKFKLLERRDGRMRMNSVLHVVAGARINRDSPSFFQFSNSSWFPEFNPNKKDYAKTLESLIEHRANVNAKDFAGYTPLMYCFTCYGNDLTKRLAELLFKAGARVNEQNRLGFTAMFEPLIEGKIDVVNWLVDRGADPTVNEFENK